MITIREINSAVTNGPAYLNEGNFKPCVALPTASLGNCEVSDNDLISLIAIKDKGAMQTLYKRHSLKIFRFLVRLMKDAALAEDVVSEVFFEVWRKASQFKAKSAVSTWLLAIARYQAYSALRRCRETQLDEQYAITIEDFSDNPEVAAGNRDRSLILEKCLNSLSRVHQEVIKLIYFQEKSIGEVAEILGVPLATVKTRAFYARNRMAQMLKERGVQHAYS